MRVSHAAAATHGTFGLSPVPPSPFSIALGLAGLGQAWHGKDGARGAVDGRRLHNRTLLRIDFGRACVAVGLPAAAGSNSTTQCNPAGVTGSGPASWAGTEADQYSRSVTARCDRTI
jgi:hypothetical protein